MPKKIKVSKLKEKRLKIQAESAELAESIKPVVIPVEPVSKIEEPRLEPPSPAPEPVVEVEKDYIEKYQYKNINGMPIIGGVITNPDVGSKAEVMKNSLLKQPRVSIFIPKAEVEDPKVQLSVNLNGYRLDFPKNVYLEVPQQIAEVIRESLNQQASALLPFQINRDKANREALS